MSAFLACAGCGVEINAESAIAGYLCARCPPPVQVHWTPPRVGDERVFYSQSDWRGVYGSAPEAGAPAVSSALVQAEPPAPPPAEQETPRAQGVPPAPPRRRGGR